jgi:formate C-acetyltransferase
VPRGYEVFLGLDGDLDTLGTREHNPFIISDEEKRELREEIFPYLKTHPYLAAGVLPSQVRTTLLHHTVNYEKVLQKGILGIKRDAEERLARLDLTNPEDLRKLPFLENVIMCLEAAAELGGRFAAGARELAEEEEDAGRKAELLEIAEICDRVPANPARTFHEAIQSHWLTDVLLRWEGNHESPGRADQHLYPYYEKDIREGRTTREAAQELVDCWFMKFNPDIPIPHSSTLRFADNKPEGHHIHAGGLKADGSDATNELSYMFVEAMLHLPGITEPTFSLLVHSKTPDDLLLKACQLNSLGGGYPKFINNDLMVNLLLTRYAVPGGPPLTLETAREYGTCAGCHNPGLQGMESGYGGGAAIRDVSGLRVSGLVTSALEFVMTNGVRRSDRQGIGLETGDPRQFKSFEEVREAYGKQVAALIRKQIVASNIGQLEGLQPNVFGSALTEDCIENGMAKEKGGARYNCGSGLNMIGNIDVSNSLAAIRKLVFEEKKVTMDQLCHALDKNFEGYEDIRKMCLEAPKFGNDDDCADEEAAWVIHLLAEELRKYETTYGGRYFLCGNPLAGYLAVGEGMGALPSGRLTGEPFADGGCSPTVGSDMQGPTAVLKSVGKIDNAEVSNGITLNMKLDPAVFENDDGVKRLADLIRVFVDQKIFHIQINVVSADTLRAAQKEPEKYKELTVKVAGYNALFVRLSREIQDSIIARTAHGL